MNQFKIGSNAMRAAVTALSIAAMSMVAVAQVGRSQTSRGQRSAGVVAGMGQAGTGSRLAAGATYTSGDGIGAPKFPNVDVIYTLVGVDGMPIVAKPDDLKLVAMSKEIGKANAIRSFDTTGYGITSILALDASGSMRGAPIKAIHSSIASFVNQARPIDKVAVVTFADDTRVDVPFGGSQEAIKKELETVQARGHYTRLYDGLLDAMALMNANQPKRRQLVVISDGHDERSANLITSVLAQAKRTGVVIDCIGLTKDQGDYLKWLQKLSSETGGTYRRANSAEELDSLIGQGIQATRATPVATFATTNLAADNALHSTQLRWQPGGLSATAFIQTPHGTALSNSLAIVKGHVPSNLWMWVLGGCFAAGLILLAISWVGVRSKRKPIPVAPGIPFQAGVPFLSPVVMPPVTPVGQLPLSPQRTPTLPEIWPPARPIVTSAAKPAVTALEPPTLTFSGKLDGTKDQARDRNRTKLAKFFEAPDHGPYALISIQSSQLHEGQVQNDESTGAAIPMTKTSFSLGALAFNDLSIPGDPTISGLHAKLFWEGSILKIEDLKSTNGTFVNGERLQPGRQLLRPGDKVRLGQTLMILDRI